MAAWDPTGCACAAMGDRDASRLAAADMALPKKRAEVEAGCRACTGGVKCSPSSLLVSPSAIPAESAVRRGGPATPLPPVDGSP